MSDDPHGESWGADDAAAVPGSGSDGSPNGNDHYARSLNDQGVWFVTAGRPHLAVRCFRRACVACPLLPAAWTNLAATLVMLGRSQEAMAAIRSAVKARALRPSDAVRYRKAIRQNVSPEQLIAHRYPVPPGFADQGLIRRPHKCKSLPRKHVSIYTLLRTAAYNMHWEKKIPAA